MKYTVPKLIDLEKEGEGPDWPEASGAGATCVGGSVAKSCVGGSIPSKTCSLGTGVTGKCKKGAFV